MTLNHDEPNFVTVPVENSGQRVDLFLGHTFPIYSRVHLQDAIRQGKVLVDGVQVKPSTRVKPGQTISVTLPEPKDDGPEPENIPLDILFEDEHIVAVNKPPAMVVHPAKGHWKGTLASALAYHFSNLSDVGGVTRPGIVHRLDRDTSGVILIAKTNPAHLALSDQFQQRTIKKQYTAVVHGRLERDRDSIKAPIGIHPRHRERMAIRVGHQTSKTAESFYEVQHRWAAYSLIHVWPRTGRTHQIRVHMLHVGHPVACDNLYSQQSNITYGDLQDGSRGSEPIIQRQALHASSITFTHPASGEAITIEAPLRTDMLNLIKALDAI